MLFIQKKPLNPIEMPVAPCIQKAPPIFVDAKKHWVVNVGDVVLDQYDNEQMVDGNVLAVARDRNQTQYGKKSYTHVVNRAFRPPLIDRDDLVPLSRLPRPTTQYRNNPSINFQTLNPISYEGTRYVKQQRCADGIRPAFFHRLERIQPDAVFELEQRTPTVSVESNKSTPVFLANEGSDNPQIQKMESEWERRNKGPVQVHANASVPLQLNQQQNSRELFEHNPKVFANAGREFSLKETQHNETQVLERRNPQVFADAKREWFVSVNAEQPDIELELHNPSVFASAGRTYDIQENHSSQIRELEKKNPTVFADARKEYGIQISDQEKVFTLEQKRPTISVGSGKSQRFDQPIDREHELKQRVLHVSANTGKTARDFSNPEHGRQPVRLAERVKSSITPNPSVPFSDTRQVDENVRLKETLSPNNWGKFQGGSAKPKMMEERQTPRLKEKKMGRVAAHF